MSALATVHGRVWTANLLQKNWFSNRVFYATITDADIGTLRTLFDKYLDHMLVKFKQSRMVWTKQGFVLFDKKWLTIFLKVLTPFWKMFLQLQHLFDV